MKGKTVATSELNNFLNRIGVNLTGDYFGNPLNLKLKEDFDSSLVEFERPIRNEFRILRGMVPINNSKSWINLIDVRNEREFSGIIVGRKGAVVQKDFLLFGHPNRDFSQWRVNPFKLVEDVFVGKKLRNRFPQKKWSKNSLLSQYWRS